jgi:hypothetical protein
MKKASDLKVFVQKFGEDNMSDLITNILHLQLNEFTVEELTRRGIMPNADITFWTWDMEKNIWINITRPGYTFVDKEILLVPKWIVRKNYLFLFISTFLLYLLTGCVRMDIMDGRKRKFGIIFRARLRIGSIVLH